MFSRPREAFYLSIFEKARAQAAKKKENAKSITRATVHLSIQFTWDIKLSVNAWWRNRPTPTGFFCSTVDKWNRFVAKACVPSFVSFILRKMFPFKIKNERIYEFVDEFTTLNRKQSVENWWRVWNEIVYPCEILK